MLIPEFFSTVTPEEAGLRLLTKDDFYEFLEECGDKLAVVDFFTDWCADRHITRCNFICFVKYIHTNATKFKCVKLLITEPSLCR